MELKTDFMKDEWVKMNNDQSSVRKVRDVIQESRRNYAELLGIATDLFERREEDIAQGLRSFQKLVPIPPQAWTISLMRRQFGNFPKARQHFQQQYGIKANNWETLVDRVNVVESALIHLGLGQRKMP